jgi:hypothetical protein
MGRYMKFTMVIVCFLLLAGAANAKQHLAEAYVRYDARYYPEFFHARGGPEGHSGAYIQILAKIDGNNDIIGPRVTAKHIDSGFEVILRGADPSCLVVSPWPTLLNYDVLLAPQDWWMTGEWEITLQYTKGDQKKITEESVTVNVPRFNFPPAPTGIQIGGYEGKTWLVWNRIGDPGTGPDNQHVEYRIGHFTTPYPHCLDEWIGINGDSTNFQLWSGNRIAFDLSTTETPWASGDLVKIEYRVFDYKNGVYRHDRAARYFFLPKRVD